MNTATAATNRSAPSRSRWLLGAALVATLLAAFWPAAEQGDETDGLQPLRRGAVLSGAAAQAGARGASAASVGAQTAPSNSLPDRSRYANAAMLHDPFATPALPWQFGGRLQVADQPDAVLLNDSTRTHTLAVGQTLDGWRLDADRGSSLDFTHLASGQHLALALTP
jgi:hypothetical protein